ncbi:MAG: hypothetical protein AAGG01_18035, partial [Planctomycetota bacterium]
MLALALTALAASTSQVQSNSLLQLLIAEGDPLPGGTAGELVTDFEIPRAGGGGGWLAAVRTSDQASAFAEAIIGQRPDQMNGPVRLLRQTQTINGIGQSFIIFASMANGRVAYTAREELAGSDFRFNAWIEDQPVALGGDPIPGSPGRAWDNPGDITLTTSGAYYLNGYFRKASGEACRALWRWPDERILIEEETTVPGLSGLIRDFFSEPAISEDGSNWALLIREWGSGRRA